VEPHILTGGDDAYSALFRRFLREFVALDDRQGCRRYVSVEVGRRTWKGLNMIRINLVDYTTCAKHVDFLAFPVIDDKDFACVPDGILPLRAVIRLSLDLKDGSTFGQLGSFLWYQLIAAPDGTYKCPMNYRH
jgi:hypothetical protein